MRVNIRRAGRELFEFLTIQTFVHAALPLAVQISEVCVFSSSIRDQKFIMASPTNTPARSCSSPASTATATHSRFQTSVASAAVSPPAALPPATSSTSASPVAAASQRRTFDLVMDLAMLRQIRSHDQPFRRGSLAMELVAAEFANLMPAKLFAVTKKTIRDRVIMLIDLFAKGTTGRKGCKCKHF